MTTPLAANANRIAVLLLPNFNALATMALIDPFRVANYLRGPDLSPALRYRWDFLALGAPEELTASNGLVVAASPLRAAKDRVFDMVFVCASWAPERYRDPALFAWLRRQQSQGAALGGVDTGAFVLGFAGLLDGYAATVHYEHLAAFEELFPQVRVANALYAVDRKRFTCCGGLAASDMALAIVRDQHGPDLANASSRYIFQERLRSSAEAQIPSLREPLGQAVPGALRRAVRLMEQALEEPKPMAEIAAGAGLSQRQLQRLFQRHAGVPPLRYYLDLRLDRARGMVTQTDLSILEISVACGFSSPEYMTKCYRERFAITPTEDRVVGRVPFQFRSFPNFALRIQPPGGRSGY